MVDHDQNRIRAIGSRQQISDEIHRRMRKEPNIIGRRHRHECRASRMTVNLETLTFKTASDVRFDEGVEARPVVRAGDSSNCGKNTRVTGNGRVVMELQNLAAKAKVSRDILLTVEVQCGNIVREGTVPVGVGPGIRKNVLGEGISGITVGNRALEIQVNEGNEKIVRQHGNVVIVILDTGRMIRMIGESIGGNHFKAGDIFQQNVVFG